jgi:hypothetical protein
MFEGLDFNTKFTQLTEGAGLKIDPELIAGFEALDQAGWDAVEQQYALAQACLIDREIVHKVMEAKGLSVPPSFDGIKARPYEVLESENGPFLTFIGGLLIRHTGQVNWVIQEPIYRRRREATDGVELLHDDPYSLMEAVEMSQLLANIRHTAERYHIPLKEDGTAIDKRAVWD